MANLGTLVAYLGINTTQLKKGEVEAKSAFTSIERYAKGAATAIAAAWGANLLKDFIKDTALASSRYEVLGAVTTIVGNNAGFTTKQMREQEMALRKNGIAMIESREVLAKMVQAQIDLNNATKLGRIAQDAAVIGNLNSSQAFEQLVYGIQSAQTEVLRTIGINVNFDQSYKKLAKSLNKAKNDLTEQEKTQARVNAVMEAGSRISGVYEASMTKTGKKVNSLKRYFDDLKTKIGAVWDPAFGKGVDILTQNLKDLTHWLDRNEESLKNFGKTILSIGSTIATGTKIFLGYVAIFKGPALVKGIGLWVSGLYSAAKAELTLQQQVASGNAILLDSTAATAAKAEADSVAAASAVALAETQVATTQANVAAIESKLALINAEKNQIMTLIQEGAITADVTGLEHKFAIASAEAATQQMNLRNAVAQNAIAEADLAAKTAAASAATEASAVAAKAATGSILTLGNALNAMFAGWVGWQIGKWLTDNFETARVAGVYFVDVTVSAFYYLEKVSKEVVARFTTNWIKNGFELIANAMANRLDEMSGLLKYLDKDMAKTLSDTSAKLRQFDNFEFKEKKIKINNEYEKKVAEKNKIIAQMLKEAKDGIKSLEDPVLKGESERIAAALQKIQDSLNGVGKSSSENEKRFKQYEDEQKQLIKTMLPLETLNKQYLKDQEMLFNAYDLGKISLEQYQKALQNLNKEYKDNKKSVSANEVAKIAQAYKKEAEQRLEYEKKVKAIQEANIRIKLKDIDLAKQSNEINDVEAAQRKIEVYREQLKYLNEIYDTNQRLHPEQTEAQLEIIQQIQETNGLLQEQQEILKDRTALEGFKDAWKDYADSAMNAGAQMYDFWSGTFTKLEDVLMDYLTTGKASFEDFAKSVLEELLRIQIRAIMVQAIMSFMPGFSAGGAGAAGAAAGAGTAVAHEGLSSDYKPRFHDGLKVNPPMRSYHNGLRNDEFEAILQTGEEVIPRKEVNRRRNEMRAFEQWKQTGDGQGSGGLSIDARATVDPSMGKRFRDELRSEQEAMILSLIKKHFGR